MRSQDPFSTPPAALEARRKAVFERLGRGALVLPAAPLSHGARRYVPDPELFYLTGATEPGTLAVFTGGDEPSWTLFVRPRDAEAELWGDARLGPEGARERFSPDAVHSTEEIGDRLPALLAAADRIFFRLGRASGPEGLVVDALATARARGARTGTGPRAVADPGQLLDELRLRKDEHEIGLLRRAAEVSVEGHRAGASVLGSRSGVGEWDVEAAVDATFRRLGASGPAYETIVGSGANACVLHYVANDRIVEDGALVLIDAGARHGLYVGDITRTYPATGRLEGAARDVYDIVQRALLAGVAAVRPGATVDDVHVAATRVLVDGLVQLGALEGSADSLIEAEAHKPFYPHRTSHWLGLDVHDVGDYATDGVSRVLEPGMVLTVEPGLYFRPGLDTTPDALRGIGVRIEDDVLVTDAGHEVLTGALPTAPGDVEALVGGRA